MDRMDVPEQELDELLNEVAAAKREASLHLLDVKFGERERIQAMKKQGISGETDRPAMKKHKKQK
jgi:hypothetical protein